MVLSTPTPYPGRSNMQEILAYASRATPNDGGAASGPSTSFVERPLITPDYHPYNNNSTSNTTSMRTAGADRRIHQMPILSEHGSMPLKKRTPLGPRSPPVHGAKNVRAASLPSFPIISRSSTSDGSSTATSSNQKTTTGTRLNKFVRRLHDMLVAEQDSGIVEWRRGLLVLHSTDSFAVNILPKYFNTQNFKTFRRQLNYYGFVHVKSTRTMQSTSTTTALWVNRALAERGDDVSSVLTLKRVEPCESTKTAEGRRLRKESAIHTVHSKSLAPNLPPRTHWYDDGSVPEASAYVPAISFRNEFRQSDKDAANILLLLSRGGGEQSIL